MESIQFGPALVVGGQFIGLPVSGRVLAGFEPRQGSGRRKGHTGLDIGAAEGTPVLAPAPGRVTSTQTSDGTFGTYVLLDHGESWVSLFAHLSRIDVGMGTVVCAGERLGLAGSTGDATRPHVHWGVSYQSTPLVPGAHLRDPLNFLAASPDRLDRDRLYRAVAHGIYGVLQAAGVALGTRTTADFARYSEGSPEWDILTIQRAANRLITRYAARQETGSGS